MCDHYLVCWLVNDSETTVAWTNEQLHIPTSGSFSVFKALLKPSYHEPLSRSSCSANQKLPRRPSPAACFNGISRNFAGSKPMLRSLTFVIRTFETDEMQSKDPQLVHYFLLWYANSWVLPLVSAMLESIAIRCMDFICCLVCEALEMHLCSSYTEDTKSLNNQPLSMWWSLLSC